MVTEEIRDITETVTDNIEFPEPILEVIKDAAFKKIKKNTKYACINGHKFKGKEIIISVEEEQGLVKVVLTCPFCEIDKILIPNPILFLNMQLD